MKFGRAVKLGLRVLACLAMTAPGAFAQATGSIAGEVRDTTGAILPGVTVEASSPALIEKTRSVVTDGQGAYKIVDLRPGTYTVTFSLAGFNTVRREGIELTTAFTANINAEMRIGSVEETITVTGETPIVDVQNVVQRSIATREEMDALPSDRNFVSFAAMTPGVFVTAVVQNVGGSVPETGMNLQVHGSRAGDSLILLDGMPIINGQGAGGLQYGNYLNNALAQEITFQTDSLGAEFERGSVVSNFIPREGSNTVRGSFLGRFANESMQGHNLDQDQINAGLRSGNRIDKIWDFNPSLGGPILKDRIWMYSAYRHWGTYNTVAGSFKDADFTDLFYRPSTEQNLFPVWHQSAAARLTSQINQNNKLNLYYDWQYTFFGNCFVPSFLTAISACPQYKNIPQYIVQGSWSSPVTNKILLEAGGTFTAGQFRGFRQDGVPENQFSINDPLAAPGMPQTWGSSVNYGQNRGDQTNYRASVSYVTGSHAVKVGMTYMHQWRYVTQEPNNSVQLGLRAGQPFQITQYATPIQYHETVNHNMGIFAQDQWRIRRLTASYGLRLDMLNAQVDEQDIPAGLFVPARRFEQIKNVPNWKDLSPRLGGAYDLFGNGKTAIKGSIGRYVVADAYTIARALNPVQTTVNSTTRTWTSPSGSFNPFIDCDLRNPQANGGCGPLANPAFGQVVNRTTNYDPDIVEGFGVRPYNWEAQVSIQHAILPRVSVFAGYSRRWYGNLFATQNRAVSNSSFTPYCITAPQNPRLPNGGGYQVCGLYDLNVPTAPNNLVQSSNNFGKLEDVFDGFDFVADARLGQGVLLSGGVSFGRERTNSCDLADDLSLVFQSGVAANTGSGATILAPRTEAFCDVHPPFQPNVKAQVSYPLPWFGVNAAATFQSLPGPQLNGQYPLSNAIAGPSLGRNFSGTAPTVDIVPPGTLYGDRIYQTDLRLSKNLKIMRTTIRPTVSIYNLFNANPILTYNNVVNSSWLGPTVIMTARFVDFGVQVDF